MVPNFCVIIKGSASLQQFATDPKLVFTIFHQESLFARRNNLSSLIPALLTSTETPLYFFFISENSLLVSERSLTSACKHIDSGKFLSYISLHNLIALSCRFT